jgi:hypothetical protein
MLSPHPYFVASYTTNRCAINKYQYTEIRTPFLSTSGIIGIRKTRRDHNLATWLVLACFPVLSLSHRGNSDQLHLTNLSPQNVRIGVSSKTMVSNLW